MRNLVVILGIPIDDLDFGETLGRLDEFVKIGRLKKKGHQVVTVNVDFVVNAMHDPELRTLLQEADLSTADGMPLVWGARLLGVSLDGRVAGADLVPAIAGMAAQKGYSIFFLGAEEGIADRAAQILKENFPGLKIAGTYSPPYGSILEMDPAILKEIKAANPDILLVAFGNPKQEKWIGMYGPQLKIPVMMGVGGAFDFIAGNKKRAPLWMQKSGLEWTYRLLQEPRRLWRRYGVDLAVFTFFFARQWWAMRKGASYEVVVPRTDVARIGDIALVSPQGRLIVSNVKELSKSISEAMDLTPWILVNLSRVGFMDSAAIGALVGLSKQAADAGGEMVLASLQPQIQNTFSLLRLDKFFVFAPDVDRGLSALTAKRQAAAEPFFFTTTEVWEPASEICWEVLHAPRRLDGAIAPFLLEMGEAKLVKNPYLIIDFAETVFLGSAGLAALVRLHRLAQQMNGELRLANCQADILRVIDLSLRPPRLSIYNDLPSAIIR